MPDARLEAGRKRGLPEGYQFGDMSGVESPHRHVFNAISGYCQCGLQYLPYLLDAFEHGGRVGEKPPAWMPDDRQRFVTRLGPGDTVQTLHQRRRVS